MELSSISDLIKRRRAIFPKTYLPGKPIDQAILEQLLENANWAPTHRFTEPWRFQVFHSEESRRALGNMLQAFYQEHTPAESFSAEKMAKTAENPLLSGAVIAIILHRDPEERVPEWEEIAAVAMAVQNMWLSCAAIGLGCYWSSPRAALESDAFFQLQPGERCLGLFYLGWHNLPPIAGKRGPVTEKTTWK